VIRRNGTTGLNALRGPLRIDGQTLKSSRAAPALGADRDAILKDLLPEAMPAGSGANDKARHRA